MAATPHRSRLYPSIALEEATDVLRQLIEAFGTGAHDREELAVALGYARSSGVVTRRIAALVRYGLLELEKKLYRPSELGIRLLDAIDREDQSQIISLLRECFLKPSLFREVVEKYRDERRLPKLLAFTLNRDHGISDAAKHDVASVLLGSGEYAHILGPDGVFEPDFLRVIGDADEREAPPDRQKPTTDTDSPEDDQSVPMQRIDLELTDGKSLILELPRRMNAKDLEILETQIEVFKKQVESNRIAPPLSMHRRAAGS